LKRIPSLALLAQPALIKKERPLDEAVRNLFSHNQVVFCFLRMVNRFGRSFLYPEELIEYEKISGAPQEEREE
jgi:hypothetical protein